MLKMRCVSFVILNNVKTRHSIDYRSRGRLESILNNERKRITFSMKRKYFLFLCNVFLCEPFSLVISSIRTMINFYSLKQINRLCSFLIFLLHCIFLYIYDVRHTFMSIYVCSYLYKEIYIYIYF
jgi:hypothetical protein